jgi:two-component system response regulator YesN
MYKILIVDDEEIIRNGIACSIDWANYGYEVVGEAENGKVALEKALKTAPDVILTDIYMPVMSGIEFSREVKKHLPNVIIIFLTGYNEFTYAQQAIEVGVFRYITKPIVDEELIQTLIEASDVLEHKEIEKINLDKLKKMLKESLPLFKERFLLNLISGALTTQEIEKKSQYLNLNLDAKYYLCVVIAIDDFSKLSQNNSEADMNLIKFSIQNMAEEVLSEENHTIYTFEEKRSEIGILCCIENFSRNDSLTILHQQMQKLQNYARQYLKVSISAGVGRVCTRLEDIEKSYDEAELALEYRMAFGRNSIILIDDIAGSSEVMFSHETIQKINDLVIYTKGGNKEASINTLNEIFDYLRGASIMKRDFIHLLVIEIVNKIIRIDLEYGANLSEIHGDSFSPFNIMKYDTLDDIQRELATLVSNSVSFIESKHHVVTRNSVEKAKDFIFENYMNPALSLKLIAESVHVSSGYFSQLFRQVSGETCTEFVAKVRIDQAKKLLKETMLKTYEIAEKVGFNDSQYFSTCFKKNIGVSPTEYRDLIKEDFLS